MVLQRVISDMFGWQMLDVDSMNAQQLNSLAGGFALRLELMSQTSQFKRRTKSSDSLAALFWERTNTNSSSADTTQHMSMAMSLMANLAKLTQHIMHNVTAEKATVVSKLFDRTHFIFLQLTETLHTLESYQMYQQLLPQHVAPEKVLTVNYKLPPPYTMFILRGGLKPIYELTADEFNQKVHIFKSILDMHLEQQALAVTDEKAEMNDYFDERAYIQSLKDEVWLSLDPRLYTIYWYLNV